MGVIEETTAGSVLLGVLFANLILGLVSVVVRFRRSTGVERQQLKWFTYAAAIVVVYEIVGEMWSPLGSWGGDFMFAAVIALIPIACGMAILRYRLYDIDRVINRTLVYAALSAVLAGVYALCVVVLPALVGAGSESDLVVASSTLLVAALFGPARRRIQGFIDRRFYRSRYDAQRTVEAFGTRLRREVQLEEVRSELLGVVRGTLQPRQVSLWLPPRGRA